MPERLLDHFQSAFNRRDIEGLLALYESSATLVMNGNINEKQAIGRAAIRQVLEGWLAEGRQMRMDRHGVVQSVDGGLAILHCTWEIAATSADPSAAVTGISTHIARRQPDGTWRFAIDCPYPR